MNNPNKEMFRKIIEEIGLYEKIKQMFSDLDKEGEEYNSEPIKTFADEKKIRAYDELEVNYLPQD
jgi:N-methylhydantoinase B/oxoprolinase/acetone carboxylase alpha subunit